VRTDQLYRLPAFPSDVCPSSIGERDSAGPRFPTSEMMRTAQTAAAGI